ncbi:hypothetical protein AVEN_108365-1 [Araneus ventricosus]|uniref:DDE-1 domain-containing protein n=1 Tax=Araneus ventricosus TaxID=182803 RepID=A0A4Y2CYK4_ARAVE|nr:hypothetical protein AVEN_108365-1 [Araneus ventricosus]
MDGAMFTDWILNLGKKFLREKRKIAIIFDNFQIHRDRKLKVSYIFTSEQHNFLQPCVQGTLENLKIHTLLLGKYLLAIENLSINLLDALHMLRSAWNLVTPKTIENCFCHAGFSKVANYLEPQVSADIETEPIYNEMFGKFNTLLDCPIVLLDEFVTVDDDVFIAPIVTNEDILGIVQSSNDPIDVGSDDEFDNEIKIAVPVPITSKLRNIVKSIRSYLAMHSNVQMNKTMDDIEQFVDNLMLKTALQKQLSDFFQ